MLEDHLNLMAASLMVFSLQKIFADLTADGISVIETSTLTEEGVMQVKTEVRHREYQADKESVKCGVLQ